MQVGQLHDRKLPVAAEAEGLSLNHADQRQRSCQKSESFLHRQALFLTPLLDLVDRGGLQSELVFLVEPDVYKRQHTNKYNDKTQINNNRARFSRAAAPRLQPIAERVAILPFFH